MTTRLRRAAFVGAVMAVASAVMGCDSSYSASTPSHVRIEGGKNIQAFTPPAVGATYSYQYKSKGRALRIDIFLYQMGHVVKATDESGNEEFLEAMLSDSYVDGGDLKPLDYTAENSEMFIYQHDVNFDGIDELAIGIYMKDDSLKLPHANSVGIAYFKFIDNHFVPLKRVGVSLGQYMISSNELQALTILGEPSISIVGNTVTIPRNLRGFYYKYLFETNGINDAGNY